jgi:hypothetical protein
MELGPGEPAAGPWRVESLDAFAASLVRIAGDPGSRPRIVAVDGRGGGGKTTLATRLCRELLGVVVHTDDIAWNHSRFGWADLMIDGILAPLHAGHDVDYQPPAWPRHGRDGAIRLSAAVPAVVVEGVGASRTELAPWIDVAVWVQSDLAEARRRGVRRDIAEQGIDEELALRNWYEWEDEEIPFLLRDQPWQRADVIVAGGAGPARDAGTDILVAEPVTSGPAR